MIELIRIATATAAGRPRETLGRLRVLAGEAAVYACCALELPYRGNRNHVSSLPTGTYVYEQVRHSPAFEYPHLWLHDEGSVYAAGDRAGVKVHIANYARELAGCIAVGRRFVDLDGDGLLDVTHSAATLNELLEAAPPEGRFLIKDAPDRMEALPLEMEALTVQIEPIPTEDLDDP